MDTSSLISQIDGEIAKLQLARAALVTINDASEAVTGKRRGRPPGSKAKKAVVKFEAKKRIMSAEGKQR